MDSQQAHEPTFITLADCTDCGAGPLASPLRVTPRPLKRMLSRRGAVALAIKSSALSLLAACAPGSAGPAAPDTSQPAAAASSASSAASAPATSAVSRLEKLDLAFCSAVLCVLPYEVARQRGFFSAEGLEVNLVYMKGSVPAMNALVAGSVDWVGAPMDVVVQAAGQGRRVQMLVSTARLPFFAFVVGPKATGIKELKDLAGKKVAVGNLGTFDHLTLRYLLKKANVDPDKVEFVALGPNLYDALLQGQVDAGGVQEPSLTLLQRAGGKVLVNFMSLKDTQEYLGGAYQFMGLNTRVEVLDKKAETAGKLVRALVKASKWVLASPGSRVVEAAPSEIVAGGDVQLFAEVLDKHKADLYSADGKIETDAVQRVIDVQRSSGALKGETVIKAEDLFTNKLLPG